MEFIRFVGEGLEVVFFFFAVAPPGLFRPDVVPQTFVVIV